MDATERLSITQGDITDADTEAIVNAANSSLLGGGGVDGAIHRAGGPAILEECRRLRDTTLPDGLPAGDAVATTAGNLSASYVIHTVGPVWHGGGAGEEETLARAIDSCFNVAIAHSIRSIAFPAISTGVYHFPKELAFRIITDRIFHNLDLPGAPERGQLVLFSATDRDLCLRVVSER